MILIAHTSQTTIRAFAKLLSVSQNEKFTSIKTKMIKEMILNTRMLSTPSRELWTIMPRYKTKQFSPIDAEQPYKRVGSSSTICLCPWLPMVTFISLLLQTIKCLDLHYSEEEIIKIKNNLKDEL